jgi:murein L,D-transpeptidase YafK
MSKIRPFKSKPARIISVTWILIIAGLMVYYLIPSGRIPQGVWIDRIVVHKSEHRLDAYSHNQLVVSYRIAIGKKESGAKQYEGDLRTPEGLYTINDRNPNSLYHKNLGISYPNAHDAAVAKELNKPPGGDIKIHGLKNGRGYIGKFHRWTDWTNGCIALTNAEVDELYEHTPLGTPIEIRK